MNLKGENEVTAFLIIYGLLLLSYLFVERGHNRKLRIANKTVMAAGFLIYGYFAILTQDVVGWHGVLFLVSLTLAFLGDILLLFTFSGGGTAFGFANLGFLFYEGVYLLNGGVLWRWSWAFHIGLNPYAVLRYALRRAEIGKMQVPVASYMLAITLHGTMGVLLMIFAGGGSPLFILGLGSLLFEISDYFLMVHKFIDKKHLWILNANSLSYFVGMLLIVLSRAM